MTRINHRRWGNLALGVLMAGLLPVLQPVTSTYAKTIIVDETQDGPDLVPGDGLCQARLNPGPIGGNCTLRAAIMEANALPGADVIVLPFGFYKLDRVGADEDQGLSGDLDIRSDTTISGRTRLGVPSQPVVKGVGDRVFDVGGPAGTTVILDNVAVEDGGDIQNNRLRGGGIFNTVNLALRHVLVANNRAVDAGGIFNSGAITLDQTVVIGNQAARTGGGITNIVRATRALTEPILGTMTITNSSIIANAAGFSAGSTSRVGGGGIANSGQITVAGSVIAQNAGRNGGGVLNVGQITMTNVTVSRNQAQVSGGGFDFLATLGVSMSLSLLNVTIANNEATTGDGGGLGSATISATNTIIANNKGGNCNTTIIGDNNLDSGQTCVFKGSNNLHGVDPRLGPLQVNGGLNETHALLPGSPAIDALANATSNSGCPATDQRGIARPQDKACDLGAFEASAPAAPTPSATTAQEQVP